MATRTAARSKRPEGIQIRTLKDGSLSYKVDWREGGTRTGERRSYSFDDLEEAKRFRIALVANGFRDPYEAEEWAVFLGTAPDQPVGLTFRAVAKEYLATLTDADRRTVAEYLTKLETHVFEAMVELPGGKRIGPLGRLLVERYEGRAGTDIVQAWVSYMGTKRHSRGKYAPKTIINIHGCVISPVFEYAVDRGYIKSNPCRGVRLPENKGKTVKLENILEEEEAPDWIACAYGVDQDTGDLTYTILGTGLRWGEATALRPCDVNVRKRTISVMQVLKEDEKRRLYLDTMEGKSVNAFRTLSCPDEVMFILVRRMKGKGAKDLLFPPPGRRGAIYWRNAHFNTARWKKVKKLAVERGLTKDPHPHSLRHSHASHLLSKHTIEAVSKRLGHSSSVITSAIYGHLTAGADAAMAVTAGAILSGGAKARHLHPVPDLSAALSGPSVPPETAPDATSQPSDPNPSAVYVAHLDGRRVPFTYREHAAAVVEQWRVDRPGRPAEVEDWDRGEWEHRGPGGTRAVRDRIPDRRIVHLAVASYLPDGVRFREHAWTLAAWEFEVDSYTLRPGEGWTERCPGPERVVEARAKGLDAEAVAVAFEQAKQQAVLRCARPALFGDAEGVLEAG
ncbi:tyrosine-type recombinase/integrase [Streptomyces albireticuli]|uniref:Tyr recombinase domain-containing protein n=1 Tax=Streptomyces albireticuli TaxID=1940 RepID=A0A2A2D9C7_9ACTN|nr:site-specific integrase [Streptomyces albireticuli]MCD9145820.1 site-specific integrase [Streptomyces albireticuli]MCD9165950.1 site-specific integrase [Streptomyces albireticuli]MCD9196178.1 site-specific integrase [Streptomyces albireticuli]PAU49093.1 hypothetical protein CK936_09675 [Streptomyces albireticuli]